jgi:fatty acid desaturase (delta-4 desaturase)
MAPNADISKLRNRFNKNDIDDADNNNDAATVSTTPLKSIKGTEVVIDDTIYDLTSFEHPGGDSIFIFGGNDVTIQYKMIHPYHTAFHLNKMKVVGKVDAKDRESDYLWDTPFEKEIKREVFKIVNRGREFGTPGYLTRAAFYVGLMITMNYFWTTSIKTTLPLAIAFGITQALIGLNVQHDANHGAASKNPFINDMLGFGADFIGGCKYNWMQQHWTHHAFTNHNEKDPDSFNAEPLLLFNDYPQNHPMRKFYHNFQALFFLPVLSGYWLSMILNPQVFTLEHAGASSIGFRMDNDFTKSRIKYAVAIRMLYVYLNIVRPIMNCGMENALTTFTHIMIMGGAESLTLAILFSLSHNFEHSDRDPTKNVRESNKKVCWFKSQVETSSTYGGFIAGALTGGLNFQVEHHLFPRMSSAWYPYIAPTVRKICKKHGVRYAYYPWVWQNFISTVKYMHQAGTGSNWKTPLKGDL